MSLSLSSNNFSPSTLRLNGSGRRLTKVPLEILEHRHNPKVTEIDLSNNNLTEIPRWWLFGNGNFPNLQRLKLSNNQLSHLPSDIFQGLTNLRYLGLENNQLSYLPSDLFQGLSNLERLWLGNNQLTNLPPNIFQSLPNLKYLGLENNKLKQLPSNIFQGLSNLQSLWLVNNQLTYLPSDIFQGLSNLQSLGLHNNQLIHLPSNININILWNKEETLKEIERNKAKRQKFKEEIEAEIKNREEKRVRRNLRIVLDEIECMPPDNYYFRSLKFKAFENFKGKHFQDLYESNPFAS